MHRYVFGSIGAIALLSGCGGGGGSPGGSAPVATPAPTPTPTPTPTPSPSPSPSGSIAYLHIFGISETDGFQPNGPPLQGGDGHFYGTTRNGGAYMCGPSSDPRPCGVIFRVTAGGEETVLHQFGSVPMDGFGAFSALIEGTDGALYGTTAYGGTAGGGTVFRIMPDGTGYRTLHSFDPNKGEGTVLTAGVILGRDGALYGATTYGGTNPCSQIPGSPNCGTIFRLTTSGAFTTLASFGGTADVGIQPNGPLVQTPDGSFYGTTHLGGKHDNGTIFRLDPNGTLSAVYAFGAVTGDPLAPQGPLVRGTDGALYGTTPSGGGMSCQFGCGTIYRLDTTTRAVTIVQRFGESSIDGTAPSPFLMVGRDGSLYGTTRTGGSNGGGTAFRVTPAGIRTTLFAFGPLQKQPYDPDTGVIEGRDGALYGMTFYNEGLGAVGARSGFGTMYRLTFR